MNTERESRNYVSVNKSRIYGHELLEWILIINAEWIVPINKKQQKKNKSEEKTNSETDQFKNESSET